MPTGPADDICFVGPCTEYDAQLCRRFGVRVATEAAPGPRTGGQWTLRRAPNGPLELRTEAVAPPLTISHDLRGGDLERRLATARRREPLPRAVGLLRRATPPSVVDATAGLGRDALVLAQLGCRVVAFERIPALAMMLEDTAQRAGLGDRVTVRCGDAGSLLPGLEDVDVVLLDPMYPEPGRAQVRKEMQVCRMLAGPPGDLRALFDRATAAARERVVVKRHPREAPLVDNPSFSTAGARVRFDVYLKAPPERTPAQ